MHRLVLFAALLTLLSMFVFAEVGTGTGSSGGSGGVPGTAEGEDGEGGFIPECSRCERLRLIGCRRNKCYYRCTRTCYDTNGTAYHEAVKFALPGSR